MMSWLKIGAHPKPSTGLDSTTFPVPTKRITYTHMRQGPKGREGENGLRVSRVKREVMGRYLGR